MSGLLALALQALVVAVPTSTATTGTAQRFERATTADPWRAVGEPVTISVGAGGVWEHKREGDLRSPSGVFAMGPVFGKLPRGRVRAPYARAQANDVCVDDPTSPAYGMISKIDAFPADSTWRSAERLTMYERAIVVGYNRSPIAPGVGSCIFLHAWGQPAEPTAGCTAMDRAHLERLAHWLDPDAHPVLVQGVGPSPHAVLAAQIQ